MKAALLFLLFFNCLGRSTPSPQIIVEGWFFSQDVQAEALQKLQVIQDQLNVTTEVHVSKRDPQNTYLRNQGINSLTDWFHKKERELGTRGILIYISLESGALFILVGKDLSPEIISAQNIQEIKDLLSAGFRNRDTDNALRSGVNRLYEILVLQKKGPPPANRFLLNFKWKDELFASLLLIVLFCGIYFVTRTAIRFSSQNS